MSVWPHVNFILRQDIIYRVNDAKTRPRLNTVHVQVWTKLYTCLQYLATLKAHIWHTNCGPWSHCWWVSLRLKQIASWTAVLQTVSRINIHLMRITQALIRLNYLIAKNWCCGRRMVSIKWKILEKHWTIVQFLNILVESQNIVLLKWQNYVVMKNFAVMNMRYV